MKRAIAFLILSLVMPVMAGAQDLASLEQARQAAEQGNADALHPFAYSVMTPCGFPREGRGPGRSTHTTVGFPEHLLLLWRWFDAFPMHRLLPWRGYFANGTLQVGSSRCLLATSDVVQPGNRALIPAIAVPAPRRAVSRSHG